MRNFGKTVLTICAICAICGRLHALSILPGLTNSLDRTSQMIDMLWRIHDRDVQTASGRVKWHGKLEREEVDTNALVKVSFFAGGTTFTDAWRAPARPDPLAATRTLEARIKAIADNPSLPDDVKELRIRRLRATGTTNTVNAVITPQR